MNLLYVLPDLNPNPILFKEGLWLNRINSSFSFPLKIYLWFHAIFLLPFSSRNSTWYLRSKFRFIILSFSSINLALNWNSCFYDDFVILWSSSLWYNLKQTSYSLLDKYYSRILPDVDSLRFLLDVESLLFVETFFTFLILKIPLEDAFSLYPLLDEVLLFDFESFENR